MLSNLLQSQRKNIRIFLYHNVWKLFWFQVWVTNTSTQTKIIRPWKAYRCVQTFCLDRFTAIATQNVIQFVYLSLGLESCLIPTLGRKYINKDQNHSPVEDVWKSYYILHSRLTAIATPNVIKLLYLNFYLGNSFNSNTGSQIYTKNFRSLSTVEDKKKIKVITFCDAEYTAVVTQIVTFFVSQSLFGNCLDSSSGSQIYRHRSKSFDRGRHMKKSL